MVEINVRALKAQASDVLRNVSRKRRRYLVTCRGRKVGVIVPVQEGERTSADESAWTELERLAVELSARWKRGADPVGIVSAMRR